MTGPVALAIGSERESLRYAYKEELIHGGQQLGTC